jgi:polyisoprenoid-binding protein YceI
MRKLFKTAVLTGALLLPALAVAGGGDVDRGHSAVNFKAQHFGAGYTWGRFNDFAGTVEMDDTYALQGMNVTVQATSVDTGIEKRDKHLRSPDFFEVDSYETITFVSTKVEKVDDTTYNVTGDLSLHGVTKEYTVEVKRTGHGDLPAMMGGGTAVGWETSFQVSQKDHGMQYDAIGDVVFLYVSLEVEA